MKVSLILEPQTIETVARSFCALLLSASAASACWNTPCSAPVEYVVHEPVVEDCGVALSVCGCDIGITHVVDVLESPAVEYSMPATAHEESSVPSEVLVEGYAGFEAGMEFEVLDPIAESYSELITDEVILDGEIDSDSITYDGQIIYSEPIYYEGVAIDSNESITNDGFVVSPDADVVIGEVIIGHDIVLSQVESIPTSEFVELPSDGSEVIDVTTE